MNEWKSNPAPTPARRRPAVADKQPYHTLLLDELPVLRARRLRTVLQKTIRRDAASRSGSFALAGNF